MSSPVLVGRDDDLATARAALTSAAGGDATVLLIGGDAGIGKSRLLQEVVATAAGKGWTILSGSCVDLGDGAPPFGPVADAVRRLRRSVGDERISESLCMDPNGLATLLPGWQVGAERAAPVDAGRVFEAVLELLDAFAEATPVLFTIEDLHWADPSTRDLFSFLSRNLGDVPVALAATVRTDDLHRRHPLRPLLAELERQPHVVRLDLGPLTQDDIRAQLTAIHGEPPSPEVLDAIWARSEGNPFYAEELVLCDDTGTCAQLPISVREGMLTRVATLPETHQRVLRAAAAAGRDVLDTLLLELTGLPGPELDGIVRDLLGASLLTLDGDRYRFRHALLQEAVYDELLPGERVRLHVQIAEHLAAAAQAGSGASASGASASGASASGASAAELAHHWSQAQRQPEAFAASVAAGLEAEAQGAPGDAMAHYQRALELWDAVPDAADRSPLTRLELLDRAAMTASNVGRYDQSISLHRAALALAEAAGDVHQMGYFQARIGKGLYLANLPGADEAFERAVALVPTLPLRCERAFVLAARAQNLMLTGRLPEAVTVATEALETAIGLGERRLEGEARNTLGTSLANQGDPAGFDHLRQALAIADEVGHAEDVGRAFVNLTSALSEAGRWDELFAVGAEGLAETRRTGVDRTHGAYLQTNIIEGLIAVGRWDDAVAAQQTLASRLPPSIASFFAVDPLQADRGATDEAQAAIERTRELPEQATAVLQGVPAVYEARVALAVWEGRYDEVPALVDELIARVPTAMFSWKVAPVLWRATWAAAEQAAVLRARRSPAGDAEVSVDALRTLAAGWVEQLRSVAEPLTTPGAGARPVVGADGHLLLAEAELARLDGTDAVDDWCAAAARFDELGIVFPAAYARLRAAEAALRTGDRTGATELAAASAAAARSLGAKPLLRLVDQLVTRGRLAVAGSGPSIVADDDGDGLGLSSREHEVLTLVAAGRTNRQIGADLYISPKTVSVHVSNILAKLNVTSRVEAAAVAHRLNLTA